MKRDELKHFQNRTLYCRALVSEKNQRFYPNYGVQHSNWHILLHQVRIENKGLDHIWINDPILSSIPDGTFIFFTAEVCFYRKGDSYQYFSYNLCNLVLITAEEYLTYYRTKYPSRKINYLKD